ncbi:putative permease [Desulfocapsa sulfexigens DSM 10523]|uniref:Putative permease n=1 Tax=Desulfocapsa sulfexigens (strain DSM 10523 / SB164P1) TaxID=1167006 RepID=M1P5D9_DESSD|nr:permease [Desulfocapsa sulfexigens]AGF78708.1 putative permease [Desulfocapsa sulfexigens DSM 10523]
MKKNHNKPFAFRGKYLLLSVLVFYGVFFLINSESAQLALQKSSTVLTKILPIFCIVILLTSILNYFVKPKQIARHLGEGNDIKGWLWALAGGVISHGPMYAWYPLLEDLRSHGMRDEYIVVFFASRAIKVPLLPIMIDYFGWTFTIVFSFYMLFGALIQGLCMKMLPLKDHK